MISEQLSSKGNRRGGNLSVGSDPMKRKFPFFPRTAWGVVLGGLALVGCVQQPGAQSQPAAENSVPSVEADRKEIPNSEETLGPSQLVPSLPAGQVSTRPKEEASFPADNGQAEAKSAVKPVASEAEETVSLATRESVVINWQVSMMEARELAEEEGKDILVVFLEGKNSSWSRRIELEVLDRPAFAVIANKAFVFLRVDPTERHEDDARTLEQRNLCETWNIRTFPTVVLADRAGRPYAITGYRNLGAAEYARHLGALQEIREKRDQYVEAADNDPGMRAIFLAQALRVLDEELVVRHYERELQELRELDPTDATGLAADIIFSPKLDALRASVRWSITEDRDFRAALQMVDEFVAAEIPTNEHLQKVLFLKLNVYGHRKVHDHQAIVKLMDQIIAINPLSEQGMQAMDVRARAQALLAGDRAHPRADSAGVTE